MSANEVIIRRYVKKNALFAIILAIMGLWLLQIVFSYLGELDKLTNSYTLVNALWFIIYKSPYFLEQFIPTGVLLGAVVGLGLLANQSELLVMQASGISVFRIVRWVLQPALIFVIFSIAINQFVLPKTNYWAEKASENKNDTADEILSVKGYWTVQPKYINKNNQRITDGKDVLFIDYANIEGKIGMIKQWHLDQKGTLQSVTVSPGGHYAGKKVLKNQEGDDISTFHQWSLNNLTTIKIGQSLENRQYKQKKKVVTLPIAPDSVYLLTRSAEDLSLTQLYAHRSFMHSQGNRSLKHELAFWQKLLSPFSIFSLVIIACSFVFGSLRTHSLGLRVVIALVLGLLFSYIQKLVGFISLTTGWSPFLMVLFPIIASAILGVWLLRRNQ